MEGSPWIYLWLCAISVRNAPYHWLISPVRFPLLSSPWKIPGKFPQIFQLSPVTFEISVSVSFLSNLYVFGCWITGECDYSRISFLLQKQDIEKILISSATSLKKISQNNISRALRMQRKCLKKNPWRISLLPISWVYGCTFMLDITLPCKSETKNMRVISFSFQTFFTM